MPQRERDIDRGAHRRRGEDDRITPRAVYTAVALTVANYSASLHAPPISTISTAVVSLAVSNPPSLGAVSCIVLHQSGKHPCY